MKIIYIETRYKKKIKLGKIVNNLPNNIGLFTTLQFTSSLDSIKKEIEKTGRKVILFKTKHTKYKGQIYGCNLDKYEGVDAFLYVGEGLFHPKALIFGNDKPVHVYNPITKEYFVLDKSLIEEEIRKQKAAFSKFLMSEKIGVLISTKLGQSYLKMAFSLEKKYPDKKFYYIVMDTINFQELDNFPYVEVWVNTACPRIGWDDAKNLRKPMIDIGSLNFTFF